MSCCTECGNPLSNDEIGIYKKLINRGATDFLCIPCLSRQLFMPETEIWKMIEEFRATGCTLFTQPFEGKSAISGR